MAKKDQFEMPAVEIGRTVLWYADGQQARTQPAPAIVTKAGPGSLNLAVLRDGYSASYAVSGVMHVEDPKIAAGKYNDAGAWDYTEFDKKLMALVTESGKGQAKKAAQAA